MQTAEAISMPLEKRCNSLQAQKAKATRDRNYPSSCQHYQRVGTQRRFRQRHYRPSGNYLGVPCSIILVVKTKYSRLF